MGREVYSAVAHRQLDKRTATSRSRRMRSDSAVCCQSAAPIIDLLHSRRPWATINGRFMKRMTHSTERITTKSEQHDLQTMRMKCQSCIRVVALPLKKTWNFHVTCRCSFFALPPLELERFDDEEPRDEIGVCDQYVHMSTPTDTRTCVCERVCACFLASGE